MAGKSGIVKKFYTKIKFYSNNVLSHLLHPLLNQINLRGVLFSSRRNTSMKLYFNLQMVQHKIILLHCMCLVIVHFCLLCHSKMVLFYLFMNINFQTNQNLRVLGYCYYR